MRHDVCHFRTQRSRARFAEEQRTPDRLAVPQGVEAIAPSALFDEALAARPEVTVLNEQEHAQELTVRALTGSYGPSLGVSTSVTAPSNTQGK